MSHNIHFPWGESYLEFPLPGNWRVLGELKPKFLQKSKDLPALILEGLTQPLSARRLSDRDLSTKKITIVVDDHSRPTPVSQFIQPIFKELRSAGAADENIDILIATGVHRASTRTELETKLGQEILAQYKVQCHNAYDPAALQQVGVTQRGTKVVLNKTLCNSDLIVCVGSIEPHLLLGFGGGLKMLLPGCASSECVAKNHLQGVDADLFDYVGMEAQSSPMRLDLEEGARMLNADIFLINCVMNENAEPLRFFCGDPIKAHRAGEKFVREYSGFDIPEQADAVIANSYPLEADLRQSIKCIGNTLYAAKPSGILMGCVKCRNGMGEMPQSGKSLPYPVLRTLVRVLGKNRILPLARKVRKDSPVEEVFISHFGLQMLRRNHLGIYTDSRLVPEDIGKKMGLVRNFLKPGDMLDWAASKLPRNPSVWIFPYGGATFAEFGRKTVHTEP